MKLSDVKTIIALLIIVSVTSMFCGAYILNAVYQIIRTGQYIPPDSFVDVIKIAFSAAIGWLSFSGIQAVRQKYHKNGYDIDSFKISKVNNVDPQLQNSVQKKS